MERSDSETIHSGTTPAQPAAERHARRPYIAPTLEYVGHWSVLTLQQSVPIGMFHAALSDPSREA